MERSILTPLQEKVLVALFERGLADRGYCLTGGTALSAFYLQHRHSDDLDFLTRKREVLAEDFRNFRAVLLSLGMVITQENISETHASFFIAIEDQLDVMLKVEFFRDVPAIMAPPERFQNIVVDSFEDIAVNKVCTILSRTFESKDFCDLFFILNESRYELGYLISRAGEKDLTFNDEDGVLMFATNLLFVRELQNLPRMVKPLSLEKLRNYFVPIAENLIQRLRPMGR